jgi:hypothetical protein
MKVTVLLLFLFSALLASTSSAQQSNKAPNWDGWQFLMGEWIGEGAGDPGQGEGSFSFFLDLQNTVIVRKNHTVYPATKGRPSFSHDDLMVVYRDNDQATRATYFDNEGHVINYAVDFSKDSNSVIFISDLKSAAPRFRLTYTKGENEKVKITFEIAPPGKSNEFSRYLEGVAHRKS